MNIIIIGCGKVGITLAEQLSEEEHDIILVDQSAEKLQQVPESIDALQIVGNGASIATLMEAGIENADILISVTGSDELNLLCCLIAKKAGDCQTIARVRNPIYNKEIGFIKERLGISMIINPEFTTATEIARLLRFPSAIKIDTFAKGRVEMLKFRVKPEFNLHNAAVYSLRESLRCDVLVAGVEKEEEVYIPNGEFVLKNGDLVSIIASPQNAAKFFQKIGLKTHQVKSCMIVGGGTIGFYLAQQLIDMKIDVRIIEKSKERCDELSEILQGAMILQGDGTDKKLLQEEGIEQTEAFVTLTSMDE